MDMTDPFQSKREISAMSQTPVKPENRISRDGVKITQAEKKTRMDELREDSPDFDNMDIKSLRAYVKTHNLRDNRGRRIKSKSLEGLRSKLALYLA
jgi:hypothetical protein